MPRYGQADPPGENHITACARYFEFYGGAADKLHGETIPYAEGFTVFALRSHTE